MELSAAMEARKSEDAALTQRCINAESELEEAVAALEKERGRYTAVRPSIGVDVSVDEFRPVLCRYKE